VQHALVHEKLLRAELGVPLPAEITAFVAELQTRPPVIPVVPRSVAEPIVETNQPVLTKRRLKTSRRVGILAAVLVTVCVGVAYAVVKRDMPDEDLMELYHRGRNAELNRSYVGLQTAAQHYRVAIERESGFGLGYAALSHAYGIMAFYDFAPKVAALDSARILAERAVALDSTISETRTALAVSLANTGHFAAAEREFRRAIELDPSNPDARTWYGVLLVALGQGEEALAQGERALKLDALGPRVTLSVKHWATYLITGQRPQRPTAERRPILKIEPGEPWSRAQQAVDLANEGRCAEARSDIARAQRLVPDSSMPMLMHVGAVHWSCDGPTHARALLAQMKRRSDVPDHAFRVAILHARFGDQDSAFVWLDRHRWMLVELAMLSAAPGLDPLRSDPRFPQLMRRLGVR
jgi:tetratricopeptide (TPR) repeat protein